MTLDQLNILVRIVEGGSLRAAAEALHRTQPTLSVAIKNLEAELNVQLFSRDQYRNILTTEGRLLYQKAKVILDHVQDFENLSQHLAMDLEPVIEIALPASIPIADLLKVLQHCEAEFPYTRVNLSAGILLESWEHLRRDEVELAILYWVRDYPELESIPIGGIDLILVGSAEFVQRHGLAEEVPMSSMLELVHVILSQQYYPDPNNRFGIVEGGREWLVNDEFMRKEIILAGLGWSRLPRHLIERELRQGLLVPLKIAHYPSSEHVPLRLARKPKRRRGVVHQRLWALFEALHANQA